MTQMNLVPKDLASNIEAGILKAIEDIITLGELSDAFSEIEVNVNLLRDNSKTEIIKSLVAARDGSTREELRWIKTPFTQPAPALHAPAAGSSWGPVTVWF
ncbi:MAG: hypothetical protein CVV07_00335 [Gammaproteobacteria bacterium HGW-Gammaproteobacteria-11]|nr:MAG: hypothetical protein CVV07_00335 [Gammaproteobacteria bacterium HGW-Gammaproteobacteria-11]